MKFLNKYKKIIAAAALFFMTAFTAGIVSAFIQPGSIQYQGENTPPASEPAFNVFYDVPSVGNEADFIRVKKVGEANSQLRNSIDTVCSTGDKFDIWIYAHNGASVNGNDNGNGPSVIKDANIRVDLDNAQESDRFDIKGFLTGSNVGGIDDGAVIDCGDEKFKMKFVSGQAYLDLPNKLVDIPASIVGSGGAPFGTNALDGSFWGCWDQRVWMGIVVEVEKIEEPELSPAVCDALVATVLERNQVRIDEVKYTANDATVNGVTIDYGDGTTANYAFNELPKTHTYAKSGDYTIRATLNTVFEGNAQKVTSDDCVKKVTIKEEPQPQYACEDFKLTWNDRKATASFRPVSSNGAVFKDATVKFYADGNVKHEVTTNQVANGVVTTEFTYDSQAKNVEVKANVRFTIGEGKDAKTVDVDCGAKDVLGTSVTPTPPTTLPDTGAGSIAGVMAAVTVAGAALHRWFTLKRQ